MAVMRNDMDRIERRWEAVLPAAPYGSQLLVTTLLQGGIGRESNQVIALPPTSTIVHVEVVLRAIAYPPPPPPETDQQRRARLIGEVLNRARQSEQLGLTTDNQDNTVTALLDALDGEFADEDMSALNPNDDDPRED